MRFDRGIIGIFIPGVEMSIVEIDLPHAKNLCDELGGEKVIMAGTAQSRIATAPDPQSKLSILLALQSQVDEKEIICRIQCPSNQARARKEALHFLSCARLSSIRKLHDWKLQLNFTRSRG